MQLREFGTFLVLAVVVFLLLIVIFMGGSVLVNAIYQTLDPALNIGPLTVPGPYPWRTHFFGLDGLVELILYVVLIMSLVAAVLYGIWTLITWRNGSSAPPRNATPA